MTQKSSHITREELIKLAHISNIALPEEEIAETLEKITAVLQYAERINQLAQEGGQQLESLKKVNVLRKDEGLVCQPKEILDRAPEEQEDYFVVPKIIKQS